MHRSLNHSIAVGCFTHNATHLKQFRELGRSVNELVTISLTNEALCSKIHAGKLAGLSDESATATVRMSCDDTVMSIVNSRYAAAQPMECVHGGFVLLVTHSSRTLFSGPMSLAPSTCFDDGDDCDSSLSDYGLCPTACVADDSSLCLANVSQTFAERGSRLDPRARLLVPSDEAALAERMMRHCARTCEGCAASVYVVAELKAVLRRHEAEAIVQLGYPNAFRILGQSALA